MKKLTTDRVIAGVVLVMLVVMMVGVTLLGAVLAYQEPKLAAAAFVLAGGFALILRTLSA